MTQDIKKICENCDKEFVISKESQEEALGKGGKIDRKYCNECLLRWQKGEIKLKPSKRQEHEKHRKVS